MRTPTNRFKQALASGQTQIGLWLGLSDPVCVEICAGAGFDWLLIDGEHGAQTLPGIVAQLQVIGGFPECSAVVRVPSSDPVVIKQYLDLGAQTLLVPMVNTAEQAARIVQACRYPPAGTRGIGGARAARWGRYPAYVREANAEICVLVQVETAEAVANLEAIAGVEGVDGVFVGPADLAASLGYPGQPGAPAVQQVVMDVFQTLARLGRPSGILTRDEALARRQIEAGARFVAVGVDTFILAAETGRLAAAFRPAGSGA
jgi:4-hydroxy-2-oxoheptanedioate aldolase